MLNTPLLNHLVKRTLGRQRQTYQELSDKSWTICPSSYSDSPPAIYLDGELDKVTAVQEDTSFDYELSRIRGKRKEHAASTAYLLNNVNIIDGYVYKGAIKYSLLEKKDSLWTTGTSEHISQAALACTWCGNRFFGHWMRDDLPLTIAAQQEVAEAIAVARKPYGHEPEYRHLFNIYTRTVTQAKCDELIIIEDFGQNQFKRQRYELLRSKLKALEPYHKQHRVMIRRGTTGAQRQLTNEAEIEQFLSTQGFKIMAPETMSATEITQHLLGAEMVVAVEGSQLAHCIYSIADGGTILTLQPPYRFNNVYKDYTDCLDMNYSFVVGSEVAGGFTIDIERLAKTIDKITNFTR